MCVYMMEAIGELLEGRRKEMMMMMMMMMMKGKAEKKLGIITLLRRHRAIRTRVIKFHQMCISRRGGWMRQFGCSKLSRV